MNKPNPTIQEVASWAGMIFCALASAVGPWIAPFLKFNLISDYYQPGLNTIASVLAPMGFALAYIFCNRLSVARKKKWMIIFLTGAALTFLLCLIFDSTVDVLFASGEYLTVTISLAWRLVYLGLFVLLSMGVCMIALLTFAPKRPADEKPS